jgi:hypothetical protein
MMNCKECIYEKCLKRTDKEFEVCPVETDKRKYIAAKEAEEPKKNINE